MNRRPFVFACASLIAALALPSVAQDFPNKPIRIVVTSAPGALSDQSSRLYGDRMSAFLKQPVVVENVAGAGGLVAARQVAKAAPDGYTLISVANTLVSIPHLNARAGYSLKDFTPVGETVRSPSLLVVAGNSPYRSLADIVADAKKRPGAVSYASGGVGTTSHLPVEMFASQAGVEFMHVPYKGNAAAVPDVAGGRVPFMMGTATGFAELMKAGQLRALGITSEARSPQFPNVPTFKEQGFGEATFEIWIGLLAPAGTPAPVIERLAAAMEFARKDPEVVAKLEAAGQTISQVRTPAQFGAVLRDDDVRLGNIIRQKKISAE
ncbi:tripartite tricarboxylate transporter substrate binding protein [Hydrogenophaga sp.]|uniref:Bug family tripartite tricarboxylate transporter substrate binding protein n=1 Tax=Hydrogenophaga sp. TaxID=1904254 RepID=UPI00271B86AD|nr:tripartite tricarboxylate transporter substrate binding protein [Hydrogenophaga sp.]MDO9433960.1 tripartite tricarboxylate transporter substrate binding protein [Hydrogenophaga sp.]